MARAGELTTQAKKFWAGLTPGKRISLIVVLLGAGGGIAAVAALTGNTEWAPLFARLGPEEAGGFVQKLKELKVPYRVDEGTLLVPRERAAELRVELAQGGLPRGGGVGFELF